ncbi:uncharacterized protein [Primulina eburnea]|uniref:uncharacterized protein n=1 Tax=Primulina eburnea TaxID=1245227 RepID=UPI003C6C7E62
MLEQYAPRHGIVREAGELQNPGWGEGHFSSSTPDMQAQMLAGMTQFFVKFVGNQTAVDTGARPRLAVYEIFRRMNPKDFSGTTDPMITEGWIKVHRVNLQTLTCNGFKEVFYSEYFTEEVRSRLAREFMSLRQGDSSVADFVREFEKGCHFVPLMANNAREKMSNFMDGLRPILRRDVRVAGPMTYAVAVSRILATEQD